MTPQGTGSPWRSCPPTDELGNPLNMRVNPQHKTQDNESRVPTPTTPQYQRKSEISIALVSLMAKSPSWFFKTSKAPETSSILVSSEVRSISYIYRPQELSRQAEQDIISLPIARVAFSVLTKTIYNPCKYMASVPTHRELLSVLLSQDKLQPKPRKII